ncbi:cysteine synthase A [Prolixibacter denitrificans]|uniref:Cysteine synthase n=1 Tax=Prolixibacter denitrificans TaxID=1541063 RepID=A0A2P8C9W4_9BACT|nr:cysteine synthase A [Prolixibacter denitrificans]PSK81760.1 cysteine synthase A [Prolixibacter denitrificans]GET21281.1 cysteine synthase [Prolixibacter denitrificans]
MKIAQNITELIGQTPLVRLNKLTKGIEAEVLVKLESFNPGGSVKDRLGLALIQAAERDGLINEHTTIIEPTSGNTGVGLAMVCASKGYALKIVMPETATVERRMIIEAYGAEVILTPGKEGMKGSIAKAEQLQAEILDSFIPMQFTNPANPEMHRKTTAYEIWNDTDGTVDIFVAGAGTGGTITGVSEELKKLNPKIRTMVVEPEDSAILSGKEPGGHKIQGIGPGFIPEVLNTSSYDEVCCVSNDHAYETARRLSKEEGIFCGISSGANVYAAIEIARRPENKNKRIVTIICDTGERYLSTPLFSNHHEKD